MLPAAAQNLMDFAGLLRRHRFAIAPDQTVSFLEAVGLLGPSSISDIRSAALALFSVPPERLEDFDALFEMHFYGRTIAAEAKSEEDESDARELTGADTEVEVPEEDDDSGDEAVTAELLAHRALTAPDEEDLGELARRGPGAVPKIRSRRHVPSNKGIRIHLRKALKEALRHDGEVLDLPETARRHRQRRIVLLVDVSGSMSGESEGTMQFAHALSQVATRIEVFSFGTRLTRITPAMRLRQKEQALERVGQAIADFDGGTRIGAALNAFLDVPRFAGFARGALVLVVSDGLERGDPDDLVSAVQRLSRIAWEIHWLTPLALGAGFVPETDALKACEPYLDHFGSAASPMSLTRHILDLARAA